MKRAWLVLALALSACRAAPPASTTDVTITAAPPDGGILIEDHDQTAIIHGDPNTVSALAAPSTLGDQRTLVLLVNFQDDTSQPVTVADARQAVFAEASDFYRQSSFNATWITGDVVGYYTLPLSRTACDYYGLATAARAAATADGVDLTPYPRLVYVFPRNACTWWGLGTVGGVPSQSWINGSIDRHVVAHEMGHNLGLYHAHSRSCGITVLTAPCIDVEYGDSIDTMGGSTGYFGAFGLEQIGWFPPGTLTTVTTSGTYHIDPYESSTLTAKALKVPTLTGSAYYVESRRSLGADDWIGGGPDGTGLTIRTAMPGMGNSGYQLDMHPAVGVLRDFDDAALQAGQTFTDAGVSITALSIGPSGASVAVRYGTEPPPPPPPPDPPPPPPPVVVYDFGLRASPTSQTVSRNRDATSIIMLMSVAGATLPAVAITARTPGATTTILAPSTVRVRTNKRGHYTTTVTGIGGEKTRSITLGLDVR